MTTAEELNKVIMIIKFCDSLTTKVFYPWCIVFICLSYFFFELFLNAYTAITLDEFWFAERVNLFMHSMPYRDFPPYKTVLGYYLLMLPLSLSIHDVLKPLILLKDYIALINAVFLGGMAFWLRKFFKPSTVLLALMTLAFTEFMLSRSTDIRVDIFAYWFCFIAVLLVFEEKWSWAGFFLGLGFLTSQKALWYINATDCGLLMAWLTTSRSRSLIKKALILNSMIGVTIVVYIACWSYFSSLPQVLKSIFGEAYIMASLNSYSHLRGLYWYVTLTNNPLLLLWPCTLISLFVVPQTDPDADKRVFIMTYAWVILLSIAVFRAPFPYYMVATTPALFLLFTAFFSWLLSLITEANIEFRVTNNSIYALFSLYFIFLSGVFVKYHLSGGVLFLGLIAVLLCFAIVHLQHHRRIAVYMIFATIITIIAMSVVYPLTRMALYLPLKKGDYQRSMIYLADRLLPDKSDYVAGVPFLYNHPQPIPNMIQMIVPAFNYLYYPTDQFRKAMLPSLSQSPEFTQDKIITALKLSSVKLYINNYRMNELPIAIKNYLASQYEHFWGSVYLYAPEVKAGNQRFNIKFSGKYKIESMTAVLIDHVKKSPGTIVGLTNGIHYSSAKKVFRLKLLANDIDAFMDSRYRNDDWELMSV